ncbi:MAG: ATP-grasp domain-containing protein [Gemmataceae bacterium]
MNANTCLVLAGPSLPAERPLVDAAKRRGWGIVIDDPPAPASSDGKPVFYVSTDRALAMAQKWSVTLLEPSLDLLTRIPFHLRRRAVEYARFADLQRLSAAAFVKPADPLHKVFDAGVYRRDQLATLKVDPQTPVLVADPVDWSAELRCFILDGQVAAWSPYLSFGGPNWKPYASGRLAAEVPPALRALCARLFAHPGLALPPAFVMDVGVIEEEGWAIVEFNPAWCAGILGANPGRVLDVLERATRPPCGLSVMDGRFVIKRG